MKQTEGTETANVSFDLGAATMNYGNNAPYFQWGRKDPMPPSTGLANTSKPIYGSYTAVNNTSTTNIAATIRSPYSFNTSNGNSSLELWNVGNTSTTVNVDPVIKSIYDPSPAGFHVPCSGAFQGWNESGRSYWLNTTGKWGRYFYQLGPNTGDAIFFPALGYSNNAKSFYRVGTDTECWVATPYSTSNGLNLEAKSNAVYPDDGSWSRYYGFSVRPVIE